MSKVLVTGGAGFLGSHLAEYFRFNGHEVVVLDNMFRGKYIPMKCKFFKMDLVYEYDRLVELLKRLKPEIVIHYAAINGTKYFYDIPLKVLDQNVRMTQNLLKALDGVDSVDKIVYASSSEVYGEPMKLPTPEDHPILVNIKADRDSYAISKAIGEFYVRLYSEERGIKYIILRIFNTYGPRMDTSEYGQVIPEFIRKILHEKEFTIYGDGKQTRTFMYVDDHVRLVYKLVLKANNIIVNIGSDKEISILELAKIMHELVGKPFKVRFLPARPYDRKRRCPDITLLKSIVNDVPKVTLEDGLLKTMSYYTKVWKLDIKLKPL